jgi:DDE superfamily endonuclease
LDGYAASHRAVANLKTAGTLPHRVRIRSSKYLNNVIEQDHRRIKQRVRPMLGFKRFETAAVTIRGVELAEKIKKHQFNLKPLTGKATTAPEMWAAILKTLNLQSLSFDKNIYLRKFAPEPYRSHLMSRDYAGISLLPVCYAEI